MRPPRFKIVKSTVKGRYLILKGRRAPLHGEGNLQATSFATLAGDLSFVRMEGMSISILPYRMTLTGNWFSFTIKEDVWIRICNVLSGVIRNHHLVDLRRGIWLPLTFTILRIYNDLTKESDKDIVRVIDEIQRVYHLCQEMPTMRSPQEKILFTTLFHLAVHTSQYCQLRVDEAGQSICSGRMVAQVQFWFLELLKPARARVFFRHEKKRKHSKERVTEQPGDSLVMIELEADEVSDISSRMRFPE
jgi:hypothetical protein